MIAPKKPLKKDPHQDVTRALKRAVAKVYRDASRNGTKLAVWKDGKACLISP